MKRPSVIVEQCECPECSGFGYIVENILDEETNAEIPFEERCKTCRGEGVVEVETEAWEHKYNYKD